MYAINYIQRNVLITGSECQYKFGNAIAMDKWNSAIEIAEARFVMPLLGWNMYNDMCNSKNVLVTSGNITALQAFIDAQYPPAGSTTLSIGMIVNAVELPTMSAAYQLLWNQYLWKYVYECVYFIALSSNYAQFTAQGMVKNNPVGSVLGDKSTESVGIGLRDVKYLEDRVLLDRINPLQTVLEQWICTNKSTYPLYDSSRCDCQKSKRTTSFLLDIYDEDDDRWNRSNNQTPAPTPVPSPTYLGCTLILNIVASPNPSNVYLLCNLQTIAKEYPAGNTLVIPHLIGLTVNPVIQIDNGVPFLCPYDAATGTFDNTTGGGFNIGSTIIINYNERV
jgi:hypothetical protein